MSDRDIKRLARAAQTYPGGGFEGWEGVVVAVLEAMRTPTKGMMEAAFGTQIHTKEGEEFRRSFKRIWAQMIDHLLAHDEELLDQ